ncbi:hypothetical protein [Myxococcus sp. RHSTA-1-4]|uniref:GspE/PulE/PilB domain-containing protein n=1 Tax=Myxococcus sp. RHSTA-1-4 TaxID=2874601 RepID=UPI00272E15DC|nr:hypothetical protein [Myxococcus sp. RHSTA-1-4]MBZ4415858.1 hypothetical protein [Myxococcus sp. RHSTA-1-4]
MAEKLGAILVRKGLITQAQLDEALKAQLIYGGRLGTNLVELDILDIDTLAMVLGEQSRYPVAQEADFEAVPDATLALLPAALAEKHLAFPLGQEGRRLKVAMVNPQELRDTDALSFATGLRIVPYVAPELRVYHFLAKRYDIKREARYIRLEPGRRPAPVQAMAVPAGAARAPAAAPAVPPAPVRPAPDAGGMFGGLAPGQFLSDDSDDEGTDTGTAPPANVLPPPAPPQLAAMDASRGAQVPGATRPAAPPRLAPAVAEPPRLAPPVQAEEIDVLEADVLEEVPVVTGVGSEPPVLGAVGERVPVGGRPGSPPRLTPTEMPRVAVPPQLASTEGARAMPPQLGQAQAAPPRLAASVPAEAPVPTGGAQPPGMVARQAGGPGAMPPQPPVMNRAPQAPGMATAPTPPPVMGQSRPMPPQGGPAGAEGPQGPAASMPPGMMARPAPAQAMAGAAAVPPGMMGASGARPPSATGIPTVPGPQGAVPPGMARPPTPPPGAAQPQPMPPQGAAPRPPAGAPQPPAMARPMPPQAAAPQPPGMAPRGMSPTMAQGGAMAAHAGGAVPAQAPANAPMATPSGAMPAHAAGAVSSHAPANAPMATPSGAMPAHAAGAVPPQAPAHPATPPPSGGMPAQASGPVPPQPLANPAAVSPQGARPPQQPGAPSGPMPANAPMTPPPGAMSQGARPPAMPGAPMPPGAARPQMPPGQMMPAGAGGPPMPGQARPMAPGMMPGAPVPPGAPMGAQPGMPPRQGPPPGGPIPPAGARGPGMPPGMHGPGMPQGGPPMPARPSQSVPAVGMAPAAQPRPGEAPQARVSGPPMAAPPGMSQVPPGMSPAALRPHGHAPSTPSQAVPVPAQPPAPASEAQAPSSSVDLAAPVLSLATGDVAEPTHVTGDQRPGQSHPAEAGTAPVLEAGKDAVVEQAAPHRDESSPVAGTAPVLEAGKDAVVEQAEPHRDESSPVGSTAPVLEAGKDAVVEQAEPHRDEASPVGPSDAGTPGTARTEPEAAAPTGEQPHALNAESASAPLTPAVEVLEASAEPVMTNPAGQGAESSATETAPVAMDAESSARTDSGADTDAASVTTRMAVLDIAVEPASVTEDAAPVLPDAMNPAAVTQGEPREELATVDLSAEPSEQLDVAADSEPRMETERTTVYGFALPADEPGEDDPSLSTESGTSVEAGAPASVLVLDAEVLGEAQAEAAPSLQAGADADSLASTSDAGTPPADAQPVMQQGEGLSDSRATAEAEPSSSEHPAATGAEGAPQPDTTPPPSVVAASEDAVTARAAAEPGSTSESTAQDSAPAATLGADAASVSVAASPVQASAQESEPTSDTATPEAPEPEQAAPRAPIELDDLPASSGDTMELASTWEFVGWQGHEGNGTIGHTAETTWADRAVDLDGPAVAAVPAEPPASEVPLASAWDFIQQPWQPPAGPSELVTSLLAAASASTETPSGGPSVTAEQVLSALDAVGTQGTLGKVLLAYCAGRFRRAFLLGESLGLARVGHAWGPGSDSPAVSALKVDLEAPSLLTTAMAGTGPSVFNAPSCAQDEAIFSALGETSSRLLVVALRSRGRPVAFVVADSGSEPVDSALLEDLARVVDKASEAYDRLPAYRGE